MFGIELVEMIQQFLDNGYPISYLIPNIIITELGNQINVGTVVEVLAVTATACVGLAFMWWGVRKVTRALMAAFKKGKISL